MRWTMWSGPSEYMQGETVRATQNNLHAPFQKNTAVQWLCARCRKHLTTLFTLLWRWAGQRTTPQLHCCGAESTQLILIKRFGWWQWSKNSLSLSNRWTMHIANKFRYLNNCISTCYLLLLLLGKKVLYNISNSTNKIQHRCLYLLD